MVEQPSDQLQGIVLEGQGRPVKQLAQPLAFVDLFQRRHRRMAEARIGLPHHGREVGFGDFAADERGHHPDGDVGIGAAPQFLDLAAAQLGPCPGHVKPAVPGEPGQQHIGEIEVGGLAPGGDVLHAPHPILRALRRPGSGRGGGI